MTFSLFRTIVDVFRNRLPGALVMSKATDVSIAIRSKESTRDFSCTVTFHFPDQAKAGNAYRAIERLYQMERVNRTEQSHAK